MSAQRIIGIAAAGAFSASLLLLSAPAQAAPDVGPGCEKIRGTIYCTTSEPVGNSHNTWDTDSTKKGSHQSSHEEESSVTNPGGNQPPGKQG